MANNSYRALCVIMIIDKRYFSEYDINGYVAVAY